MTRDSPNFKVIVVGAGIGGIACAVECKRKGYNVSMYDAAHSFARLGDTIGVYLLFLIGAHQQISQQLAVHLSMVKGIGSQVEKELWE